MYMQFLGWSQIVTSVTAICTAVMTLDDGMYCISLMCRSSQRKGGPGRYRQQTAPEYWHHHSDHCLQNFQTRTSTILVRCPSQSQLNSTNNTLPFPADHRYHRMADIQGGKETSANSNCILCDICYDVEHLEAGHVFSSHSWDCGSKLPPALERSDSSLHWTSGLWLLTALYFSHWLLTACTFCPFTWQWVATPPLP